MAVDLNKALKVTHSANIQYRCCFDIRPHMINFHVGIIMNNINNFFDYVFNSDNICETSILIVVDTQTRKRVAGWDFVLGCMTSTVSLCIMSQELISRIGAITDVKNAKILRSISDEIFEMWHEEEKECFNEQNTYALSKEFEDN
eukprot:15358106-Ditylum_brightwellii.AAC.1